ncbi:site-specific DNA-methyltransferase [Elstera sp.]|jgi:adenine-specific DNA-methyltransferase|uniref:site-specific DNA-methyltransferase n=1 Tax=Elstera sp. TaxID=1916664 RepID=UPI0037C05083
MPTLDWIGKRAVINHHRDVPYRLIHCDKSKSAGDPDAGNLLVQGDNLEALKALLPYYAGKVKCIYIDPPYNTGNEGWIYNDNVNSPEIRAWLGKVVGKEAEDLSRHDKWLCMMYPRLRLLKEFLSDDGSLWVSIDDNEVFSLKTICDEIFGRRNFKTTFIWKKVDSPNDNKVPITPDHEFILCYEKEKGEADFSQHDAESILDGYTNRDEDGRLYRDRLLKKNGKNSLRTDRQSMFFPLSAPDGSTVYPVHDDGREACWALGEKGVRGAEKKGLLIWKQRTKGDQLVWVPYTREFAPDTPKRPHFTILSDVKTSRQAKAHQTELLPTVQPFDTVKPEELLQRILSIATSPGDIVMDSFAGSGTTGAVAHKMGRTHISVEMGEHAVTHCVPRLKQVIDGEQGGVSESVVWEGGGGFRYCTLGEPLFDAYGNVSPSVTYPDLAAHVFFCETGSPIPRRADGSTPLIGTFQGRAIYLLHAADSVGVPNAAAGNVLTAAVLETLPLPEEGFTGARIVYAEGCSLPDDRLNALGVTFKQVPYQIEGL